VDSKDDYNFPSAFSKATSNPLISRFNSTRRAICFSFTAAFRRVAILTEKGDGFILGVARESQENKSVPFFYFFTHGWSLRSILLEFISYIFTIYPYKVSQESYAALPFL
jgi:hypothetical protein